MLEISPDVQPLSNSMQNTADFIRQLQQSGEPIVLTVNGQAELVVQDRQSYQKLLELVDWLETIEAIREGLKDAEEGRVVSMEEAMEMVRKKHGIPL